MIKEEWLLIVEALELRVSPGEYSDENRLNLTWEMIDYTESQLYLQLYFEYPDRVSEYIEYDTLEVYFWGVEWFKSEEGVPVRYGTRLETPIIRQIDPVLAGRLGELGHYISLGIACFLLLTVVLTRRLLPTWMFLNSLQLISHLSLFKSRLPPTAAYFMSQFIDIAKFNPCFDVDMAKGFGLKP